MEKDLEVWKENFELSPFNLVVYRGKYFLVSEIDGNSCTLLHPFNDTKITSNIKNVSRPVIVPWAEAFLKLIKRNKNVTNKHDEG